MTFRIFLRLMVLCALLSFQAKAQSPTDKAALKGLAPVTVLSNTDAGNAALGANYAVTGGIQTGVIAQPTLLPFAEQQQQALRDVFITDRNLAQLADALGTTLGAAYLARAHYIDRQRSRICRRQSLMSSPTQMQQLRRIQLPASFSSGMKRRTARRWPRLRR
jgi:hypothetical protein